ncbi:MAG: IS4 family transposase [Alicyclobacillaceae bacterium]|nr:IS4 family transposase [Alicyclobacillaceae bacterium]
MDNATRSSCFGQWISFLNVDQVPSVATWYDANRYVKKLDLWAFLRLFLYAQVHPFKGLRDLEIAVQNNEALKSELGLDSISISQLSRTSERLNPDIFRRLFLDLVREVQVKYHRDRPFSPLLGLVKIIDSTTLPLCLSKYAWAKFRKTKAGVKIHTRRALVDSDHAYPDDLKMTWASVANTRELSAFVDDPNVMYVFDRGYLDLERLDDYCDRKIRFATRLKENATYEVVCDPYDDLDDPRIIRDTWVRLGSQTKVMRHLVRRIETQDSTGNRIVILTNDLFAPALERTELYRHRWQMELFFNWMKQHLKLTTRFGTSPNAVENQIYVARMAYLLMYLLRGQTAANATMLTLQRLLRELMWRPWDAMAHA